MGVKCNFHFTPFARKRWMTPMKTPIWRKRRGFVSLPCMSHKIQHADTATLVKALGKGSVEAFDRLYLMFRPKVDRVVGAIVGGGVSNYQIINDIVQNIFLKVWKKREQIAATVRDFDAYLFRMTKNESLNFLSRYTMPFEDLQDNIKAFSSDETQLTAEARDLQERVAQAMQFLPPQQRRVFELSRINQLSYQEIAKELGISPKTVENHLSRALKDIKKTLS